MILRIGVVAVLALLAFVLYRIGATSEDQTERFGAWFAAALLLVSALVMAVQS
jgi:hypothetical protein